jgi:hypothetical protein
MFPRRIHALKLGAGFAIAVALLVPGNALAGSGQTVKSDGVDLDCSLESVVATGHLVASARDRSNGTGYAFVDVFVDPTDDAAPILGGGTETPSTLTKQGLAATFEMADDATGNVIGSGTVAATFKVTHSQHFVAIYQSGTQKGIYYTLSVVGSLSVTSGANHYTFDMAGCDASAAHVRSSFHDPRPPKPGAKVPTNDLPASALPIAAGGRFRVQTDNAALDPEAECIQTFEEGPYSLPFGRTVWFKVTGTGRPITVDPAGSDFDTVVAAYRVTGAGLEQLACIDDGTGPLNTPKQASVTIDTQVGATYLVQVGGIGDVPDSEFGHLRVKVY